MQRRRVLGLVGVVLLWLGGISLAEDPYTWAQVVERGMPNFNDQAVAQEAVLATHPLSLSFPSGAAVDQANKGATAARTCLKMMDLKKTLRLVVQ